MAGTFTQIYIQIVFAVSWRQCLIPRKHKSELHSYIGELVNRRKSKPLAIHCMPDHAHIFIGYRPSISLPDLVKEIKVESNQFMNMKKWTPAHFKWQEGYGAFSYSRSHIGSVIEYVHNQEEHHRTKKFSVEYKELLREFDVPFEDRFLFEFFD